jgi:hypothetical protein
VAPRCIAAASNQWNSGRFVSIRAIVEPRSSPSPASPAAVARTFSAYSRQVMENSSPLVRSAQRSGWAAAVAWNASATVEAWSPAGRPARSVVTAMRVT